MSVPTVEAVRAFGRTRFKEAYELLPEVGELPTKIVSINESSAVKSSRGPRARVVVVSTQLIVGTVADRVAGEQRTLSICLFQQQSGPGITNILLGIPMLGGQPTDWQPFEQATLRYPFWCVKSSSALISTLATYYLLPHINTKEYAVRDTFWSCFRAACERIQDRRGRPNDVNLTRQIEPRPSIASDFNPPIKPRGRRGRTPDPDDIAYMAQAYKRLKTEQAGLQNNIQSDQDTIIDLKKQLDHAKKIAEDANLEKVLLGRENMELSKLKNADQQLQEAQKTIQSLSAMNQELEQQKTKLQTQVDDLEQEIKKSRAKFTRWRINIAKAVEADVD